ncbi:MAG: ATP-binding protein [Ginsengibacter sp.]
MGRPTLKILLLFVTLFCRMHAVAQTKNTYQTVSIAQGLSQGMVFDILQDRDGFIWVATKNGLNRYNGYGFKVYTNDPYSTSSLSSNTITELFEDRKGRIWAGSENSGLNILDKQTGKIYRIMNEPNTSESLSGNRIRPGIIELPDGRILVAVENAGFNVIKLSEDFFTKNIPAQITRLKLPNNTEVYSMGKDQNNNIYIAGYDNVVYQFNPDNSFRRIDDAAFLNNGYMTEDGSLWINKKLFLWNGKELIPLFDETKEYPGNIVFKQREGLWPSYHQEQKYYDISKYKPGVSLQWNQHLPVNPSVNILYPFIIDKSGILWAGTKGYGLRKYNTGGNKFHHTAAGFSVRYIVPKNDNEIFLGAYPYEWKKLMGDSIIDQPLRSISSDNEIDNIRFSENGDYWLRTDDRNLMQFNPATKKTTSFPTVIDNHGEGDKQPMMEDSKGNIWFPSLGGVFSLINTTSGQVKTFSINTDAANLVPEKAVCTAIYEDGEGVYWTGTENGFAKLTFSSGDFTRPSAIKWYTSNPNDRNSLNYNSVSCFLDDPAEPSKYVWICTKGGGLNRLEKSNNNFIHLTQKEGLPDDVVYGILTDDARNIWGSTNRGIFCLIKNKGTQWEFRNYSKPDGLQDDEFNTGAYEKLGNGRLAFGGVNGLNIFSPKEILKAGFSPNVFITNILVNNQPAKAGDEDGILKNAIEQTKSITLSYVQDILTLEFSSLDYTAPEQNKYRYQLAGIDKEWVESGTRRTATYLHLPSGSYTFKVQGTNSQGNWSDKTAELQITVLPPWWKTWWAYLCFLALLMLCIRYYIRFTANRAKLKAQLNYEQLEAKRIKETDNLKTQLYTNITHEFRTPLTVILGMAKQIAKDPAGQSQKGIEMIIRNGQSLLKLVNEMLDLSKLQSGKMPLNLIKGDIITFLRYIVESFHSLAENQSKQLHFLSELESYHTEYDAEKMQQIISNLLSNALKFTPERGNIYISVNETEHFGTAEKFSLIIKIKDTGIGIPENKLPFIFDRFYQLDSSNTRTTEGSGIGLSLTKELVRLMSGHIIVKSPPPGAGRGTEFTIELPFRRIAINADAIAFPGIKETDDVFINGEEQYMTRNEPVVETDERQLILLVEDNADVVAYTASCLTNYRLAVAKDGREGFEIATEIIPDLIISDVMMPFMDGFELLEKLRNDENTSHIPIIMLTAKADVESKIEGIEKGADAYIEKPFNHEELQLRIKKLLELRKKLQGFYLKKAGLANGALPGKDNEIAEEERNTGAKTEDRFVTSVRDIIEKNLGNAAFSVEHLCKAVFMSHSKLHRKLDALTGCPPNKFIRIMRLKKAKELLQNDSLSIASVAMDCGFNDPGYFSRVFKQEFGLTPQEWRQSMETKAKVK